MQQLLWTIGLGLLAGTFSGLLGVGGGIILVPAMVFLLKFTQHRAHGTSLGVILFLAAAGLISYINAGQINWGVAAALAAGGIVGAVIGARIANRLSGQHLRFFFGIFIVLVALRLLSGIIGDALGLNIPLLASHETTLTGIGYIVLTIAIGLMTGILSGLMGVGGGIIMVPAMVLLLGFSQPLAQGISLAVIIPTAISGAFVHYKTGNIHPRDVLMLAAGGIPGALIGSRLAVGMNELALQTLFSMLLIVVGIMMVTAKRTR